ncbi:synaptotagmin-10-like [Anthonomus grandis grandis]|uniref:synaptotagmin-10-like n=1 Tax=Anthonomus grandis grandis TaxID=2921223 RepID=UPI002165C6BA|nr:synaptotagmin-10-like [Anthonomus grandis grandis]
MATSRVGASTIFVHRPISWIHRTGRPGEGAKEGKGEGGSDDDREPDQWRAVAPGNVKGRRAASSPSTASVKPNLAQFAMIQRPEQNGNAGAVVVTVAPPSSSSRTTSPDKNVGRLNVPVATTSRTPSPMIDVHPGSPVDAAQRPTNDTAWLTASLGQQAAFTWKWLRERACSRPVTPTRMEDDEDTQRPLQGPVQISNSMPDLAEESKMDYVQEFKEIVSKKVLRQTTLPIVSERHQTFQRQFSHTLDMRTEIKFSICSLDKNHSNSKIGIIQPELYKKEMLQRQPSIKSENEVKMVTNGFLHFALKYDKELEGLVVKIFEARDLPIKDTFGTCDPYVKIHLLPDRKKRYQTKVHRKSLNPIFNETFIFSVTTEELESRYLQLSIYDFDRFARHDLIGHITVDNLYTVADFSQQDFEYTMPVLCPPVDEINLGELMVCLCFLPKAGRLTITIIKGRNFKAMDITGKSDPYVKVYLIWQGRKLKKKKTTVRHNTLFPVFNEALVFDVPTENINEVSLLVKVIDYDRIGQNEIMGCFTIGPTDPGKGRDHWLEMLENARKPVAQWYPLLETVPVDIHDEKETPLLLKCWKTR